MGVIWQLWLLALCVSGCGHVMRMGGGGGGGMCSVSSRI